ncbi:MAG: hypothetical protein H6828_13030 [Planctomycetes bacterium]|nr:hypothetical protein [Planctomycetota bacterium]
MLAALALATLVLAPAEGVTVHWKGRPYEATALPAELGRGPAAALDAWSAWAASHDYRFDLSNDGRVLLVGPTQNGKVKRQLTLIEDTCELFDELFPAPVREAAPKEAAPASEPAPPHAPDEPDDGPSPGEAPGGVPTGEGGGQTASSFSYEWGAGTWPVDTETCVLFVVDDEEDYGSLLDALAKQQEYLKDWVRTARTYTGFVLEQPLAAAYIENARGMEEWDADNEVVHRAAQLLMVRRFSQLPYWFVQGFAWHLEFELRKGIYCYPYRASFVWATEHTGWDAVLKTRYKERKDEPLRLEDFTRWRRGAYVEEPAKVCFGLARFLARYHATELTPFAEELRLFRDAHNRVDHGDGTWERVVNYEVPEDELLRMLQAHFGDDVLLQAAEFFRKGKSYRPPKR